MMDRISNLPDSVINLILKKLDFYERVVTSALSRSWRYRWTHLSSLPLHNEFYEIVCEYIDGNPWKYANLVNSLLLQNGSCIREFTLYIPDNHLSRFRLFENAIRSVTRSSCLKALALDSGKFHDLSNLCSSIFSLVNLRDLFFRNFRLNPPSWFKWFPNITRLELVSNIPTADVISHFISICPQLQEVILDGVLFVDQVLELEALKLRHLEVDGDFKDVALLNAPNLEYAKMWLVRNSDEEAANSVNIFDHLNNFAQVKEMLLGGDMCKLLGRCSVIDSLSRFSHMETLEFTGMDSVDADVLKCVLSIFAASRNVRDLNVGALQGYEETEADPVDSERMVEKYITEDFRHLQRVELSGVRGTKTYMKIVESLLRFSPILEVMCIEFADYVIGEEKFQFVIAIIKYHRASTKVQFEIS